MKIELTEDEVAQLLALGLEHQDSPLRIADGFEPTGLKLIKRANGEGGASLELAESEEGQGND